MGDGFGFVIFLGWSAFQNRTQRIKQNLTNIVPIPLVFIRWEKKSLPKTRSDFFKSGLDCPNNYRWSLLTYILHHNYIIIRTYLSTPMFFVIVILILQAQCGVFGCCILNLDYSPWWVKVPIMTRKHIIYTQNRFHLLSEGLSDEKGQDYGYSHPASRPSNAHQNRYRLRPTRPASRLSCADGMRPLLQK